MIFDCVLGGKSKQCNDCAPVLCLFISTDLLSRRELQMLNSEIRMEELARLASSH